MDLAKQIAAVGKQPEPHKYKDTAFTLTLKPLSTLAFERIMNACNIPAKGRKKKDGFNSTKCRHMVYGETIKDWSGLSASLIRGEFKINVTQDPDEIPFSQGIDIALALADEDTDFNAWLWKLCVPSRDDQEEDTEELENEKKT
jgi:hypothetical protein